MSVTVHYGDAPLVRSEVPSTYVIALAHVGSGVGFYKIGRTKNLTVRLGALLSKFNDGSPKGHDPFPDELLGHCAFDGGAFGGCKFGADCVDHQWDLFVMAHIEGDFEGALHRRFAATRLPSDELHNGVVRGEWFYSLQPDECGYERSVDAWLAQGCEVAA